MRTDLFYIQFSALYFNQAIRNGPQKYGEFEPRIIGKYEKTSNQLKNQIIAMYAKGMSTRDIEDHMRDIYGFEIFKENWSKRHPKLKWHTQPMNPSRRLYT